MLYAVTQKTAAEIIIERADETKPNMNLQTWEKSRVRKTDVIIAKNYLVESEVKELERLVTMFLDYAENQAMKKIALKTKAWLDTNPSFFREFLPSTDKISYIDKKSPLYIGMKESILEHLDGILFVDHMIPGTLEYVENNE